MFLWKRLVCKYSYCRCLRILFLTRFVDVDNCSLTLIDWSLLMIDWSLMMVVFRELNLQ